MKPINSATTSACRHCRHYTPEGRRGGHCQRLSVPVLSQWQACSLAIPAFIPAWQLMEGIGIEELVASTEMAIVRPSETASNSLAPETVSRVRA